MATRTEGENRAKFVELAENRVARAIKDIRLIGNLANKSNYTYTAEDTKKIIRVLKDELEALKARFDAGRTEARPVFKL